MIVQLLVFETLKHLFSPAEIVAGCISLLIIALAIIFVVGHVNHRDDPAPDPP